MTNCFRDNIENYIGLKIVSGVHLDSLTNGFEPIASVAKPVN